MWLFNMYKDTVPVSVAMLKSMQLGVLFLTMAECHRYNTFSAWLHTWHS